MAALAAAALAGCATTPEATEKPVKPATEAAQSDPIGDLIAGIPETPRAAASAKSFIGQPVSVFERTAGAPALIRPEGGNEFRRYDLAGCRLYAIVIPAGGEVASIAVGPAVVGSVMPSFGECLAARSTGS